MGRDEETLECVRAVEQSTGRSLNLESRAIIAQRVADAYRLGQLSTHHNPHEVSPKTARAR